MNKKTEHFIACLRKLLEQTQTHRSLEILQEINETFYMQKIEEFILLEEQLHEAIQRVQEIQEKVNDHYLSTYHVWKKDVRWLNTHLYLKNPPQKRISVL